MLIPREKPYMQGLNSYYLDIGKFVEHLQGEIGSGCIYCRSSTQEILVYFDEQEILRGIVQDSGQRARVSPDLKPVMLALARKSFSVQVFHLDANAIFFWGQLPPFQRAKAKLRSSDITLPDLVFRLRQKRFSGFVDIRISGKKESAVLFFHDGRRIGGSYSWGHGGLNASNGEYNLLLGHLQAHVGTFAVGHFLAEQKKKREKDSSVQERGDAGEPFSNLVTGLEEFLEIFVRVAHKKTKTDPVILLKQTFLDRLDVYPFLDPFLAIFDYVDREVQFASDAPREEIADAVVDCAWQVIKDNRLQKQFQTELGRWSYRSALEERGILVER